MSNDYHFRKVDRVARNRQIAEYIVAHPNCLGIAIENLDRWEAWGRTHPGPIQQWRKIIESAQQCSEGFQFLINFLQTANPDTETLLSCSPLVGLDSPLTPTQS